MKKYFFVIALVFIFALGGIIKVNVEYNKINHKAYDAEVYKSVFEKEGKRSEVFGEFVLNRKKNVRVRMYYTYAPFDLRFSVGNKVLYINSNIFKDIKERFYAKDEK